jgi:hypothetical protein
MGVGELGPLPDAEPLPDTPTHPLGRGHAGGMKTAVVVVVVVAKSLPRPTTTDPDTPEVGRLGELQAAAVRPVTARRAIAKAHRAVVDIPPGNHEIRALGDGHSHQRGSGALHRRLNGMGQMDA